MEQLAIRLSWQTTPAKSLVMRGDDEFAFVSTPPARNEIIRCVFFSRQTHIGKPVSQQAAAG
ncbi:MAG TPA: hypothetical protein VIU93_07515 [Gallionellaceae bacterium]